jgi:hypothetical protein
VPGGDFQRKIDNPKLMDACHRPVRFVAFMDDSIKALALVATFDWGWRPAGPSDSLRGIHRPGGV